MWFAENPLKIYMKINIPIEIFKIILFFIFSRKIILYNKKSEPRKEATILHSSSSHHMSRMSNRAIFRVKPALSPPLSYL